MATLPRNELARLVKALGMVGSSHDGKVVNAIRLATRIPDQAGVTWPALLETHDQLAVATEAASVLLAENNALKAELEQARAAGRSSRESRRAPA